MQKFKFGNDILIILILKVAWIVKTFENYFLQKFPSIAIYSISKFIANQFTYLYNMIHSCVICDVNNNNILSFQNTCASRI